MSLGYERRRIGNLGPIIDKINIGLSAAIIICAAIILLDIKGRLFMFPVVFTLAALLNALMCFKCYKMAEMGRMVCLGIATIVLTVLSVIGYIVTF